MDTVSFEKKNKGLRRLEVPHWTHLVNDQDNDDNDDR